VRPSQIRASAGEAALMIPGAAGLAKHHSELSRATERINFAY
jgi:hypothetical protein